MTTTTFADSRLRQAGAAMPGKGTDVRPSCAVRLVDRRAGQTHRVNGSPVIVFTRQPDQAMADLLKGRDRSVWEVRIDRLQQGGAQ